jgi:competence protein ComK
MEKGYFINQKFVCMSGEYNEIGKLCSRVTVGEINFLVDMSPEEIIEATLNYIGYDLKGAKSGARAILGNIKMCPVIAHSAQNICVFPHKSPTNHDAIWFNVDHIVQTRRIGKKTQVDLSNGLTIIIDSTITSFHTKMAKAYQLKRITGERNEFDKWGA